MFIAKGKVELKLRLRRRKSDGGVFYHAKQENIDFYLFANKQIWKGITKNTKNGAFMFKTEFQETFQKFGFWRKQKDGSILVFVEVDKKRYGLVGVCKNSSIWLYWADTNNSLEKLIIRNNYEI